MLIRAFILAIIVGLTAGFAARAAEFDVDVKSEDDLAAVDDYLENGVPASGPRDFTSVGTGDILHITNTDAAGKTASASDLTIAGGGRLRIGFDRLNAAAAGALSVNLQDSGNFKHDMIVGDASGAGSVVLGMAGSGKAVGVSGGGALEIVNGSVVYAAGVGANVSMSFETMNFVNGTVTMGDNNSLLQISGVATIGGGSGSALLVANGNGLNFVGGLEVAKGGTIRSGDAATVRFGSSNRALLKLTGGTLENTDPDDLVFNTTQVSVEGDDKSVITATGAGNIQLGDGSNTTLGVKQDLDVVGARLGVLEYSQQGGTVVVENGGSLTVMETAAVTGSESVFAGTGEFREGVKFANGATLGGSVDSLITTAVDAPATIDAKSFLDLTTNKTTLGASTVLEISGTVRVGGGLLDAGAHSDAGVVFADGSVLRVDDAYRGQDLTGRTVIAAGAADSIQGFDKVDHIDDHFLLGEFHFDQNASGSIYVSRSVAGEKLDGTDFAKVRGRILDKYGRAAASEGFIENIYKSVSQAHSSNPLAALQPDFEALPGSALESSYLMNIENFKGFATNHAAVRDGSLAAMYTGLNNSGVADVAISTSNQLISRVQEHVRYNSAVRAGLREDWCDTASQVASAMNAEHLNHAWVSGFGMWEDAGANKGVSGYRYEAAGFIGGYDRAYGPLTVGGVLAYAKGDYSDKSAIRHDSTISSYSAALHATFNREDGFYAGVAVGYTYSDNDINELRGNAAAASGVSWNRADYHSNTINGSLEAGYDILTDAGWRITPSIGVRHIRTYVADHRESLGGVAAGRITDVDKDATFIPVRFDVGYALLKGPEATLRMNGGIGYTYNVTDSGIGGYFDPIGFANASRHRVKGRESDQHFVNASLGLQFVAGPFEAGAQYEFSGSSHTKTHRLQGAVGLSF